VTGQSLIRDPGRFRKDPSILEGGRRRPRTKKKRPPNSTERLAKTFERLHRLPSPIYTYKHLIRTKEQQDIELGGASRGGEPRGAEGASKIRSKGKVSSIGLLSEGKRPPALGGVEATVQGGTARGREELPRQGIWVP